MRFLQNDHLSGKPANVREFYSCQGNVGILGKKSCRGKLPQNFPKIASVCFFSITYLKGGVMLLMEAHFRATERHLPYGIPQCYLPPNRADTGECAPP